MNPLINQTEIVEYVIIGAGPAAICAIPNILNMGVTKDKIIWIDPEFKVGAFGTTLSKGSSVPGNTMVKSYRKVYNKIYQLIPSLKPCETHLFELDQLTPNFVGSLKIAAKPMQYITNGLRDIIPSVEGLVTNIVTTDLGLKLEIKLANHHTIFITTKRAILATGSQAKTYTLPYQYRNINMIDVNTAFIQTELTHYLQYNPKIKTVAVIGSSHSAALATMHLLKAGLSVKQFMNKEYKYATPIVLSNGAEYLMHDNTGLKGDVAQFTKLLLKDINEGKSPYFGKLTRFIGKHRADVSILLEQNLRDCTHAVATIGYIPSQTLFINGHPISSLKHNSKTTAFEQIPGLFGIGIAFPQMVKNISGEYEAAVGVEKFWTTTSNIIVQNVWQKSTWDTKSLTTLS